MMFQLTREEVEELSRSKILTSFQISGIKGGRSYLPYAFTEQGIYMLMTVLRGELAIKQSIALVRIFKAMKDFIVQRNNLVGTDAISRFIEITNRHTDDIRKIKDTMVTKDELAVVIRDFTNPNLRKDYLILNGEAVEADIAYSEIYSSAKKSVYIIDDYISLKTLQKLKSLKSNIKVIVFSDNVSKDKLTKAELEDFRKEYPNISVSFKRTDNKIHDRFITMDFDTVDYKVYLCGLSSKDSGNKLTTIQEYGSKELLVPVIRAILNNDELELKR